MYDFLITLLQDPVMFVFFIVCFIIGFIVYILVISIFIFGGSIKFNIKHPRGLKEAIVGLFNIVRSGGIHR